MKTISVVVGNPKAESRTLAVAEAFADRLAPLLGAERGLRLDLAAHAADIFTWPHDGLAALADEVSASDFVVVASPTYKAAYTGLLKAFLDRYPSDGLRGVTAFPVFTIGSPAHTLAVEFTLRPLLVELGASVPAQGLSFLTPELHRLDEQLDQWFERNQRALPVADPAQ
ncbi:NAD(P)H-dependent oxidoreductase [Frankia sp. CNm7]|uniref:NAD(P)H-dependent oxidoreductase n=1 Tax=Frankia nepalensis TaxID=1836974 RepID=A0A937RSR6_9ACTN|nr:NAD(P)H-dependent oxidoreductase [Frankia nepalensis]MBL7499828.1 NAD(P)H-dependent oxidoreductase [Frankia nepalensis]MBL7513645.1 NAD(P)H-dependent oxidoreductase [Frankia nepalensis]MBL7521912.1 NAD(P)H-dependent oxidoreductase [Frankia nepalensis]MBL7631256.1 NAD(P)H-dependent oxidoreductase [Frankia nepalensis]